MVKFIVPVAIVLEILVAPVKLELSATSRYNSFVLSAFIAVKLIDTLETAVAISAEVIVATDALFLRPARTEVQGYPLPDC